MSKLMKDDSAYTFSELPRINPNYKVQPSIHCSSELVNQICADCCAFVEGHVSSDMPPPGWLVLHESGCLHS